MERLFSQDGASKESRLHQEGVLAEAGERSTGVKRARVAAEGRGGGGSGLKRGRSSMCEDVAH